MIAILRADAKLDAINLLNLFKFRFFMCNFHCCYCVVISVCLVATKLVFNVAKKYKISEQSAAFCPFLRLIVGQIIINKTCLQKNEKINVAFLTFKCAALKPHCTSPRN